MRTNKKKVKKTKGMLSLLIDYYSCFFTFEKVTVVFYYEVNKNGRLFSSVSYFCFFSKKKRAIKKKYAISEHRFINNVLLFFILSFFKSNFQLNFYSFWISIYTIKNRPYRKQKFFIYVYIYIYIYIHNHVNIVVVFVFLFLYIAFLY